MAKKNNNEMVIKSNLVRMGQISGKVSADSVSEFNESFNGYLESKAKEDPNKFTEFCESLGVKAEFKEDHTMSNSTQFTIQKIAKMVFFKTYSDFAPYRDAISTWTPDDFGGLSQSNSYKIPKIYGTPAVKLATGEKVAYVDAEKAETIIETERYGTGLRVNDRFFERAGPGVIERFIASASLGVQTEIWQTVANGMVTAASQEQNAGISVEEIQKAKQTIVTAEADNGIRLGLRANTLVLTPAGTTALYASDTYKLIFTRNNNLVGGDMKLEYAVHNGMKVLTLDLIDVEKSSKVVYAMVLDKMYYMQYIQDQSSMKIWSGRLPGTAGDMEYIFALDMGFGVAVEKACVVITAA